MTINSFENYVEDKIVERGRVYADYIDKDDVEQIDKGEFSASIMGTDEYHVYVKLNNNHTIEKHSCTCPYDWGNVCKHEVAVFLYIRREKLHLQKGLAVNQLKLVLEEVKDRELRAFIYEKLKKDRDFREDFMFEFG